MFSRLTTLFVAIACLTACGGYHDVSAKELVVWHKDLAAMQKDPARSRIGYRGSDENSHYFIARPVDSFTIFRVPRAEIKIADERPLSDLDNLYYYVVDPAKNFRVIQEPSALRP